MTGSPTQARSILDASPRAARWAWIINGCLFAIGALASSFVYFSGRVSEEIMRAGPSGEMRVESAKSQADLAIGRYLDTSTRPIDLWCTLIPLFDGILRAHETFRCRPIGGFSW